MSMNISESNKRIVKNTLYMYLRMFAMLIVALFTTRVVFRSLGVNNYGIYNVVASLIVLFSFITNGLQGATRRYITAELADGDFDSQQRVFSLALQAHGLISVIVLILGETVGLWFLNNVLNIPDGRMVAANFVYQFSILSSIVGIMTSPYQSAIIAHEKMSIYAWLSIFDVMAKLGIALLIYVIAFDKLILYGFLLLLVMIGDALLYIWYCHNKIETCKYKHVKDIPALKSMFVYMGWALFGQASYVSTQQGITMLINVFVGVVVNAAMGVSNQITGRVSEFVSNFQVAFNPQITKLYIKNDQAELNKLVIRGSRYTGFLILIFMVPISFEVRDFLTIWLGNYPKYTVGFCVLTIISMFFQSTSNPLTSAITSDSNIKKYQLLTTAGYALDFGLCWLLLWLNFVPYIVIIVQIIINLFLVGVRLYMMKEKVKTFPVLAWLNQVILRSFGIILIPSVVSYLLLNIGIGNIWLRFLTISALSCFTTCLFIFLIGMDKKEKSIVLSKLRRK